MSRLRTKSKAKKVSSNLAYAILCMHIDNLKKQNDIYRIRRVDRSRLYFMLTSEKQKSIIDDKIIDSEMSITGKLCRGEITPMMLPEESRTSSTYIYYLRYLKYVYTENPCKAKALAKKVLLSVLVNDLIPDKTRFDEDYFSVLLAGGEKQNVCREETVSLNDRALFQQTQ